MSTVRPIPALTSIRGLAAWWVVLYHFREEIPGIAGTPLLRFMAHGYLAVDLFFELSGFVIALNYARTFRSVTWADSTNFFGLRLARIYPLHIFILLVFLINPIAITLFSMNGQPGDRYSPGYFILSVLLFRAWKTTLSLPAIWALRWSGIAFFMSALVASLDEWHQTYIPSRTGAISDVMLDSSAALTAQIVIFLLLRAKRARMADGRAS